MCKLLKISGVAVGGAKVVTAVKATAACTENVTGSSHGTVCVENITTGQANLSVSGTADCSL